MRRKSREKVRESDDGEIPNTDEGDSGEGGRRRGWGREGEGGQKREAVVLECAPWERLMFIHDSLAPHGIVQWDSSERIRACAVRTPEKKVIKVGRWRHRGHRSGVGLLSFFLVETHCLPFMS